MNDELKQALRKADIILDKYNRRFYKIFLPHEKKQLDYASHLLRFNNSILKR